jgi:hypothetical protein
VRSISEIKHKVATEGIDLFVVYILGDISLEHFELRNSWNVRSQALNSN